jgi:DNA-binding PucR family transcriptional regulator
VRVPAPGADALVDELRHLRRGAAAAVGISAVCRGPAAISAAFAEARDALRAVDVLAPRPPLLAYDELGAYRYLLRLPSDTGARDAQREGLRRVAGYDAERRTTLLRTLEEFLTRHGSVVATADALHVHPNTLRQRLRRVEELSGLSLAREDWLALEIALKLVRLEAVRAS